jgi:quinohemoprotein ethanol dehydrogenase
MATGGNLVFQGNAEGEMVAYAANTGEELWSVQTGSAINAAPASYSIDGAQYVLIPIGMAGGLQYRYPDMHAANRKQGPVRLMAFSLNGDAEISGDVADYPSLPEQPALEASDEMIALGGGLYDDHCGNCHGPEGAARFGGSVPDLRYSNKDTHAIWHGIVVGGLRSANGMPSMEISIEESEAIRNYVLALSEAIRAGQ